MPTSAPIQPGLSVRPHNNQQLFSDHYLDVTLPNRADWQALTSQAAQLLQEISGILAAYQPSPNEAQTEETLIKPVLKALGHPYEVQASLKTPDGTKTPDYVFYRDTAALNANKGKVLTDELPQQGAYAVGDAKYWERPLDQAIKAGGDPFTNKNPSYQIAFYMQHSGVDWGILTNGRKWRLYHKSNAHKLDRFYEVDLPELLATGDPLRFLYFYAFFHRSAFEPHTLGVAAILQASAEYARGVGDTLKTQIYDALRHLAQGFLDYTPNSLQAEPATLKQIYDASLIVLYRSLFILYAEARDLLPLYESIPYRNSYSLKSIKEAVARDLDAQMPLLSDSATLWPRVKALYGIINTGSPPLKVATFNGGLFDPQKHPFLERYTVGDAHLQQALDKLARVNRQFVDYRDLSVRHLGTIYEGLLEYHLEPMQSPGGGWSVDLLNDKGERKATGSYYTPDYIVKYIVEQTLGPVLSEAVSGLEDEAASVNAVLATNVLDPAMGSGHFLVEATEYIARYLVELGIHPPGSESHETDFAYWKRRVVQSCIYGVDLNPLAVELAKLSLWLSTVAKDRPLSFLDHHLRTGNSLVGARLSEVKIDQAATLATSKRKRTEDALRSKGFATLFGNDDLRIAISSAVNSMWLIERNPGLTIDQVKEQEKLYSNLRDLLTMKYGRLANLGTAQTFGLEVDVSRELWPTLVNYLGGPLAPALDAANQMAAERRFFHWELEFPEVFFDENGQPLGTTAGFDAVVGNPPYIRQEQLGSVKPYLARAFPEVYHGTADIFVYFIAQGLQQLRRGGYLAYISSNSWLRANYATPLRSHLRTAATVETLVDLGDNRVFADAPDVYPAILIVKRETPSNSYSAKVASFTRGEGLASFERRVTSKLSDVSIYDQSDSGWQLGDDVERRVFNKLMASGKPLGEVVRGRMYRGVLTGLNDAFIIDQATRDSLISEDVAGAELIKPLVNGEDVRPWFVEDEGRWLIFARRGIAIDRFQPIKRHLEKYRTQLEPRPADWNSTIDWPGRKPGSYEWYEVQDAVDYYAEFEGHKIFWPEMAKQPRFALGEPGIVGNKTTFMIPGENLFLLGVLMARPTWFSITKLCVPIGERKGMLRYTLSSQFIAQLPIPDTTEGSQEKITSLASLLTTTAGTRYNLHRRTRYRIFTDLGAPGKTLNQKLTTWWELDFKAFRAELQKIFKRDIPIKERDEWEEWFEEQGQEHVRLTDEIVRLETELNAQVYALFDLSPEEIEVIERATKYKYGEV